MTDLENMAEKNRSHRPPLQRLLPKDLWPESGSKLKYVTQFVNRVSTSMYIRYVDKGTGVRVIVGLLQALGLGGSGAVYCHREVPAGAIDRGAGTRYNL